MINLKESQFFTGINLGGITKEQGKEGSLKYKYGITMRLIKDRTKGEAGEFRLSKKKKKKEKKKKDLKKVDLEAKGREELGVSRESAREAMKGLSN
jgi:hypothetical protein